MNQNSSSKTPLTSPTWIRYEVLLLLTSAAAIAYIARNAVGVAETTIRADLGLSLRQSGWFMAAFFPFYAALQVPSGSVAHRHGSRFAMVLFACGWSTAALLIAGAPTLSQFISPQSSAASESPDASQSGPPSTATATPSEATALSETTTPSEITAGVGEESAEPLETAPPESIFVRIWELLVDMPTVLWVLLAAQVLMGAAQAGLFPAACHSISHWMPLANRSFACGALSVGMQIGAIIAGLTTGDLIEDTHWRWVFVFFAVPGFLWALVFCWRFRNHPTEDPRVNAEELAIIGSSEATEDEHESTTPDPTPWTSILTSSALWFLCGQQMCRAAGYMFFATWFPTFLQETQNVSVKESGYLQALVFTGTLTGSLFGGVLTDWIWRRTGNLTLSRNGVGSTFLFLCAGLILAAWYVKGTILAVSLLSIGALLAAMAGPCAIAATIDIGGKHVPQVYGIMNMAGNFAAAASPILIAELFEWTSNWAIVLQVFAVLYLVGGVSWLLVDCRQRV